MRIFTVNFIFPNLSMPVRLVFKDETTAKSALHAAIGPDGSFSIHDDFDTEIRTQVAPITRIMSDVVEELEANTEISLLQHRAQMKAQKRAQSDPTLSNSPIIGAGGPVLPFPGGRSS